MWALLINLLIFYRPYGAISQSRFLLLLLLLLLLSIPKRILASVPRHFFSRHLGVLSPFGLHLHNEEQIQDSEFQVWSPTKESYSSIRSKSKSTQNEYEISG